MTPIGKQLVAQLSASPISEVTGIVSIHGVSAGRSGDENLWGLNMKFDVWRSGDGCLKTETLHFSRQVTDKELKSIQNVIKAETIVKVNARVVEKSVLSRPDALFEEFIEVVLNDNELKQYLEELKKPVTYSDNIFGTLTFDRQFNWYEGNVIWNGKNVTLDLSVDDPENIKPSLKVAKELWEDQVTWDSRISDYAVNKLLQLKNEEWLGDEDDGDEPEVEVTAEQFKARMSLETISVDSDGEFEFWHNDGDLFFGHSILVSGNLTDGPDDAGIHG